MDGRLSMKPICDAPKLKRLIIHREKARPYGPIHFDVWSMMSASQTTIVLHHLRQRPDYTTGYYLIQTLQKGD